MAVKIQKKKTHTDLAQYLHVAYLSPVKSTFEKAIKKHFKTCPGLTPGLLKHLPISLATVQGHLHQKRQNLQSTKKRPDRPEEIKVIKEHIIRPNAKKEPGQSFQDILQQKLDEDSFPDSPTPNNKTHDVACMVVDKDEMRTVYTDLTGRFPYQSSRGNEYLLIAYHYDGNCIVEHVLKIEKKETITAAWNILRNNFISAGAAPNTCFMDNNFFRN